MPQWAGVSLTLAFAFAVALVPLPTTTAAATLLAARLGSTPCLGTDVILVVAAAVVLCTPIAAVWWLWWRCGGLCQLRAVAPPPDSIQQQHYNETISSDSISKSSLSRIETLMHSRLVERLAKTLRPRWKWHALIVALDADGTQRHRRPTVEVLRASWVVLREYRVMWYASVDAVSLLLVSSLAVVGGIDVTSESLCRGCTAAVVALLVLQCIVVALTSPLASLFSIVHSLTTLVLTCLSIVAQLAFIALWMYQRTLHYVHMTLVQVK
ncbi:membrane-associated protein, putative [Bodo saltans]|uniref:Membrane-associated protein, putative n=1 Tax=Bodo saltans TaxID=75058 RepID=A0A0S4KJP4_BODSA|nr:membrane-associated protein, putative [Bodo saltans]|eukprot:CUI14761.1 membrane-associated protein, putative [Bodo saltans]